jgi:hypothetical protein
MTPQPCPSAIFSPGAPSAATVTGVPTPVEGRAQRVGIR